MNWSPQQETALIRVRDWLKGGGDEPFYLAGYAGTGKTTLAKHFAEGVEGRVRFAAYTGKAALVMQQRGCAGASTIHSLIYLPRNKNFAGYEKIKSLINDLKESLTPLTEEELKTLGQLERELAKENKDLKAPAFHLNIDSELRRTKLLIVDECSMIDKIIGEDLLSFKVPILVLGDPAQLPPVGGAGYFTKREPNFLLTEIHRQAADNPIIYLATLIRRGEKVPLGTYGETVVHDGSPNREQLREFVENSDQIICGLNKTRRRINRNARKFMGWENPIPEIGDKVICLRNNANDGLLNGSMWKVESVKPAEVDSMMHGLAVRNDDNGTLVKVNAHSAFFEGTEDKLEFWQLSDGHQFDYGYAITAHKSQGSQWGHTVVLDESFAFRSSRKEWLYTAITRASERMDLVRI